MERAERLFLAFFATTTDGSSAALFRVALGTVACWQAVAVWLNLRRFWGDDGFIPYSVVAGDAYQMLCAFRWAPASQAMLYGHAIVFSVAAVTLLFGFFPRVSALLVAYVHLSLQFRNPFLLNSGDRLFMIVAALAVATPLGHRFSVDALLRRWRGQPTPERATVWGLRLLQLQLAYVYLNSVLAKLGNGRWQSGMALRDVLASPVFAEWPAYIDFTPLIWLATYSTLVFELAFPLVVWFRRLRPWVLLAGVGFHVGIDVVMVIPIFSFIMIATYPVCLDDQDMARLRTLLGRALGRRPSPVAPAPDESGAAAEPPPSDAPVAEPEDPEPKDAAAALDPEAAARAVAEPAKPPAGAARDA